MTNKISFHLGESRKIVKNNSFDYLLMIFITMQIFGAYEGALQPVRLFIILCSPFTVYYFITNKKEISHYRHQYELFVFPFWILYAWITMFWVVDTIAGLKEIFYLHLNFLGILTIYYLSKKANNPHLSIILGWMVLFILGLPIAIYEIVLDIHLSNSFLESGTIIGGIGDLRKFASVTFGNYNAYNVSIVYCLPFIYSLLFIYKKALQSYFIWFLLFSALGILSINASRGSLICYGIFVIIFIYYIRKYKVNKAGIAFFIITTLLAFLFYSQLFLSLISERVNNLGFADNTRSDILTKSLQLLLKYDLLGVGTGNFQATMKANYNLDIYSAHNFFLEVLIPYGLVVFILFIGLFIRIYKFALKNSLVYARYIVFASLIALPFVSVINSGYILGTSVWLQIGSLYIIADCRFNRRLKKFNRNKVQSKGLNPHI